MTLPPPPLHPMDPPASTTIRVRNGAVTPVPGGVRVLIDGVLYEWKLEPLELIGLAGAFNRAAAETLRALLPPDPPPRPGRTWTVTLIKTEEQARAALERGGEVSPLANHHGCYSAAHAVVPDETDPGTGDIR